MTYEEAIARLKHYAHRLDESSPKAAARVRAAVGAIERDHEAKLNRARVLEGALTKAREQLVSTEAQRVSRQVLAKAIREQPSQAVERFWDYLRTRARAMAAEINPQGTMLHWPTFEAHIENDIRETEVVDDPEGV